MNIIDKVAPLKKRWVKQNSQEWFDGEIADEIKKSKVHIDKDIYNAARYKLQEMIINKKRVFFENTLTESIGKPKDL